MLSGNQGLITAITELENGTLVSLLDVEQILSNAFGEAIIVDIPAAQVADDTGVFFVDDSIVARRKIAEVFDKLAVKHKHATNGQEAWSRLQGLAAHAQQQAPTLRNEIRLILVDAEMPEMDGYVLTKHIKADSRFDGIPVVMHSSLGGGRADEALVLPAVLRDRLHLPHRGLLELGRRLPERGGLLRLRGLQHDPHGGRRRGPGRRAAARPPPWQIWQAGEIHPSPAPTCRSRPWAP